MLTYLQFLLESEENSERISKCGNFSQGSKNDAPLVFVFGGIPVGGRQSGDYMYDYFDRTGDSFHLFVAESSKVKGMDCYNAVMSKVKSLGLNPKKKILYLFSGGYRPGMDILERIDPKQFDRIYLVDIWMGSENPYVSNFYLGIAASMPDKVEYYYTDFGAQNKKARDKMVSTVKVKMKNPANAHTGKNSSVNVDAVNSLIRYASTLGGIYPKNILTNPGNLIDRRNSNLRNIIQTGGYNSNTNESD